MVSVKNIPVHPLGTMMKAVCFNAFGKGKDVLSLRTIPKPFVTKPNDVLIKVHACALNPIDRTRLAGDLSLLLPEPYETSVLGYDVSGVVEEIGNEVDPFKVGDEVFVRLDGLNYGAMAEHVVCQVPEVASKPSNISFSEAAAVPLAGLTSLQALRRGGVKEGSKVFIPGGAGGVGSIAIQIAKKMLKASHVCTTASPGVGMDICKEVGADQIIDYRTEDFEEVLKGEDFDMVFDTMNQASQMGGLLKEGGKIISISGNPTIEAIESIEESPSKIMRLVMFLKRNRKAIKAAKSAGGTWEYIFMYPSGKELSEIAEYIEKGDIKPIIDSEAASLDDYEEAIDKLWSGRAKGKCVIKVV
jgi:NADPH:quinone reductase-like Zn-dependent oxidoreductase